MDKAKLLIPTKDLQITYYVHFKSILLCTEKKKSVKKEISFMERKKKKRTNPVFKHCWHLTSLTTSATRRSRESSAKNQAKNTISR